ncbi:LA_1737 family protein [Leptospira idonii]|uniref:LPS-assembly protein LptD n=1 Tax=Leptospira idonii TaxID=1193500 RepID=A0A4R9M1H8_9LEPT|nr:hypothetical protein [Leptospira idonii]TGN19109.1 hypothetical protein EHS15_10510 [Leptospira idonii]
MFQLILFLSLCLSFSNHLFAEDFSDLEETRVKVYGSEKDKKYRLDGFFIEWENWPRGNPTHNHFHLFWFANTTEYPKFKKSQIFPFFSSIESKIDARKSTNYLLLYNSSVNREGYESTILFPFYFSGNGPNDSNSLTIFPVFHKSSVHSKTNSSSKLFFPGYYQFESKEVLSDVSTRLSISPFHYLYSKNDKNNENVTAWFPLLPLFYHSEDKTEKHNNYFMLVDTNQNKDTKEIDRFWFLPFLFWERNSYLTIFPAFFSGQYGKSESYSMVPILYFHENQNGNTSHTNVLLLYDQALHQDGGLDRLWVMPFYFYKKDNYHYVLPFFFQNTKKQKEASKNESAVTHSWFGLAPPIYRSYSENHSTFYLINFYTNTAALANREESTTAFFPFYFHSENSLNESKTFIPFLYFYKKETNLESHTNSLLIYDQSLNAEGNLERLFVFPFYFYKKNSYNYIVPFYFSNEKEKKQGDSIVWGPFYYSLESERLSRKYALFYYNSFEESNLTLRKRRHVFPFFYSWETSDKNLKEGNDDNQANGFLLFPFFYRNKNKSEETYSNLLGFFSWTKDKEDILVQKTIFPIRFYQKNSHSIWFPFSFQFGQTEERSPTGSRWGAFFYSSWSPEREKLWIINYYSDVELKQDQHSRTFFPFYHSWKGETSKGTLVIPLYIDADFLDEKEKDKYNNFNVNVLGIASQTSKGIFQPSFSVDGGKKEKYYYLDTDVSWLYYAFRLSNRTSTKLIQDLLPYGKQELADISSPEKRQSPQFPKVEQKRSFTRADSFNFFGVNLLFGVFGYEAADSKRHVRLLPLAWFTYDTEVDENIYAGPLPLPFVWYSSSNLKYRVIFPIYGYQSSEDAERHSYGLFLFLKENVKEKNTQETSVLWPFVNWHQSDVKSGSRILPFYWQRTVFGERQTSDSLILPLTLSYLNTITNDKNQEKKTWISPFLIRLDEFLTNGKESKIFPTVPFFYWNRTEATNRKKTLFISPVYFYWNSEQKIKDESQQSDFWLIPIVGFESRTNDEHWLNYFLLYNKSKTKKKDFFSVFPFYSQDKSVSDGELVHQTDFYFPFVPILHTHRPISTKSPIESNHVFSPFLFSTSERTETEEIYKQQFFPIPVLYTQYDKKKETNFLSLLLLFQYDSDPYKTTYRFLPFVQFSLLNQNPKGKANHINWVFPFFWKSSGQYYDRDKNLQTSKLFLSLVYSSFSTQEEEIEFYPMFLYYSSQSRKESFRNFLLVANHSLREDSESYHIFPFFHRSVSTKQDVNVTRDWFFPFYYISTQTHIKKDEGESLTILPALFYFSKIEKDKKYRNWFFLFQQEETPKFASVGFFPFFHFYSDAPDTTSNQVNKSWIFPFYFSKSITHPKGRLLLSNFVSLFYVFEEEYSKEGKLTLSKKVIPPLLYSYEAGESFSEWNLFFFMQSRVETNKNSFDLFPIYHSSKSEKDKMAESKNWLFPIYYSEASQNLSPSTLAASRTETNSKRSLPTALQNKDSFHFITFLFRYSYQILPSGENDYETTFSFPVIPVIYRKSSESFSHTNLFYVFDRRVEKKQLKRFFLFPFYYSNEEPLKESSVSYYHFFPFYFSGVDDQEYTAFVSGLYLNSNEFSSYKNFLFLMEQESVKKDKSSEFDLLFRSIHYKTAANSTNFRFLYGVGEVDLRPKQTQMNLVWLGYEHTQEKKYINLLPFFYEEKIKSDSTQWITPALYYSHKTDKTNLEHSALGLVYFNSENLETKESLENILLGIIYYKTVKPKERGYTGRGSFWGALWEYNTEEETNYSKFSILKIIYSRREDSEGVRHRILFFEF